MERAPLPATFRQRLLPTTPESLPPGVEDAARMLCGKSASVDAAFLSLVSVEADGNGPTTQLELGVKLSRRIDAPRDIDHSLARPLRTGLARDPAFGGQLRLAFLADRAVDAWATHGVQVFPAPE